MLFRSEGRSEPGSFQITASALGPSLCEILCAPFESRVSISYSPLALRKVSPTGLQSPMFWKLFFLVQDPQAGKPNVGSYPSVLRENFCNCNYPPFVGRPPKGMGLDSTLSPPLLHIFLWFLLYIFSCRRSFLLVFRSFSSIFAL